MKMIGTDIIEVERIRQSLKNENFIGKILTKNEIEYVNKFKNYEAHIAGFFACKEAVMKALQDCKKIGFTEIEVWHKETGAPYVKLYGEAQRVFNVGQHKTIEVSISQTNNYATAVCLIV